LKTRLLGKVIEELDGLCDREESHGRCQEVDEKFTRVGELIELARKAVGEDDCDLTETLLAATPGRNRRKPVHGSSPC
jgi:hypothetical protein